MSTDVTPVQWSALTSEQRNQLVATKVMGLELLCSGRLTYGATDALCQQRVYVCMTCNALVTAHMEQSALPELHTRSVANYSQSLDAAWLVVEKMKEPDTDPEWEGNHSRFADFTDELVPFAESSSLFDVLWCITPEAICIAALRACGFQVEVQS